MSPQQQRQLNSIRIYSDEVLLYNTLIPHNNLRKAIQKALTRMSNKDDLITSIVVIRGEETLNIEPVYVDLTTIKIGKHIYTI